MITMHHLCWVPPTPGLINRTKQIDHCLCRSPLNSLILEHFKNMKFFFHTSSIKRTFNLKMYNVAAQSRGKKSAFLTLHCDYKEDQCSF